MIGTRAVSPGQVILIAELYRTPVLRRRRSIWRRLTAPFLALCIIAFPGVVFAQWAVHDALNFVKNSLTEAHLVEQLQQTVQIFQTLGDMRNAISHGGGLFKAFFAVSGVEDLGKFTGVDLTAEVASALPGVSSALMGISQSVNDSNAALMQARKAVTGDVAQIQSVFGGTRDFQQSLSDGESVLTSTIGFVGPLSTALPSMTGLDVLPDDRALMSPASARLFSYQTFGAAAQPPDPSVQDWRHHVEARKELERFNAVYDAHGQALYQAASAAAVAARLQKLESDAHTAAASDSSDLKSELYQLTHSVLAETGEIAELRALLAAFVRMEAAAHMPPGTSAPPLSQLAATTKN